MTYSLILLAGGKGERFGATIPKQFMSLNGKKVIQYSLDVIEPLVDEVIIVSPNQYKDYLCVEPGETRGDSVKNGLDHCTCDCVIVHEAVRPFVTKRQIEQIKELLKTNEVVDTITPLVDGFIDDFVPKSKEKKFLGLAPEGFDRITLLQGFANAKKKYQDEVTMLYDLFKITPAYIEGTSFNSKITYSDDLGYAEGIMKFWNKPIDTKPDLTKKVLVLGGSGGIGSACMRLLPNSRSFSREALDLSKDFEIDLSDYEAIIHAAGEYANESKIMAVNFDSCVKLVKLAEDQNWKGNIVFLSSASATFGRKGIPIYSASKSALNAYIESRAEELAEKGIYINAIAPAKVDTPLQASINPNASKDEMMSPDYVADYVCRYIDTDVYGHIIYLKNYLDV